MLFVCKSTASALTAGQTLPSVSDMFGLQLYKETMETLKCSGSDRFHSEKPVFKRNPKTRTFLSYMCFAPILPCCPMGWMSRKSLAVRRNASFLATLCSLFCLFVCLFTQDFSARLNLLSVWATSQTLSVREGCKEKENLSLSRHAEAESAKKHRAIRWDIVNILQSLYPWAIAWTASHRVMVSYGNCRQSFWSYTIFLEGVCRTSLYGSELVWVFIYTHFPEFYFIGEYLHCSPLAYSMLKSIFYHPVVFPFQWHNFVWTLSRSSHTKLLLYAKITLNINPFQLQLKFIIYSNFINEESVQYLQSN